MKYERFDIMIASNTIQWKYIITQQNFKSINYVRERDFECQVRHYGNRNKCTLRVYHTREDLPQKIIGVNFRIITHYQLIHGNNSNILDNCQSQGSSQVNGWTKKYKSKKSQQIGSLFRELIGCLLLFVFWGKKKKNPTSKSLRNHFLFICKYNI